jgi:hypothetical protein
MTLKVVIYIKDLQIKKSYFWENRILLSFISFRGHGILLTVKCGVWTLSFECSGGVVIVSEEEIFFYHYQMRICDFVV